MQAVSVVLGSPVLLPLVSHAVCAGFPSPADDFLEGRIDLSRHLVTNAASTFVMRVEGDSMVEAGISPGCLIVVDRSLSPKHWDVVVADVDGTRSVKRYLVDRCSGRERLDFANRSYPAFHPGPHAHIEVFGVVTSVVRTFRD